MSESTPSRQIGGMLLEVLTAAAGKENLVSSFIKSIERSDLSKLQSKFTKSCKKKAMSYILCFKMTLLQMVMTE